MKDLFELLGKIFSRENKPRVKREKPGRQPLPDNFFSPGPPPTPKEAALLKNKNRIKDLEKEIAELRAESSRQVELLEQLTRQLSSLQRSVTHLLPEK